jgi:hypothetical protein
MTSFLSPNEDTHQKVCITGVKALRELSQAVESYSDHADPVCLLLTIVLHRYAEVSHAIARHSAQLTNHNRAFDA